MTFPQIRDDQSLDNIRDDLVYTHARLSADKRVKDLAPPLAKLIARVEKTEVAQRDAWRDETLAQALVDKCDDDLDDQVGTFAVDLTYVEKGKKNTPRYKRYFEGGVADVVRLGLASEVTKIVGWLKSLASEKEPALKAQGKALSAIVKESNRALEAQTNARSARADQRIKEILPLIDDLNSARLSIAGEIDKRAAKLGLPHAFSSRFFRHASHAPAPAAAPAPAPAPTAPPATTP